MRSIVTSGLIVLTAVLVLTVGTLAAVPSMFNYQGFLTDSGGNPISGTVEIAFSICADSLGSACNWTEFHAALTVTDGQFNVKLGSIVPITDDLLTGTERWLGINVEGESFPYMQLVSVPFAHRISTVDGASGGTIDGGITVNSTEALVFKAEYVSDVDIDAIAVHGISYPGDNWGVGGRFEGGWHGLEGIVIPGGTYSVASYTGIVGEAIGGIAYNTGISGSAGNCEAATGVYGYADNATTHAIGVDGLAENNNLDDWYSATGVRGTARGTGQHSFGVAGYSESEADWNYGVYGHAWNSPNVNIGVGGFADQDFGNKRGGNFLASGEGTNFGVYADAWNGTVNYSIYGFSNGSAPNAFAGYFQGDVHVNGTLSKSGGSFKIDHPMDPENKYLQHSFIESPDMMNVYNGNVVTDTEGRAVVELPDYFETLNTDFRYQLTVIGQFAQAIVREKIRGNQFVIMTDKPNIEVSWQVTGIRQDPWAQAHPIEVEVDKLSLEQGKYLNPELYGFDQDRAIHTAERVPPDTQTPDLTKTKERDKK